MRISKCPLCGLRHIPNDPDSSVKVEQSDLGYRVKCDYCGLATFVCATVEDAIDAWRHCENPFFWTKRVDRLVSDKENA